MDTKKDLSEMFCFDKTDPVVSIDKCLETNDRVFYVSCVNYYLNEFSDDSFMEDDSFESILNLSNCQLRKILYSLRDHAVKMAKNK